MCFKNILPLLSPTCPTLIPWDGEAKQWLKAEEEVSTCFPLPRTLGLQPITFPGFSLQSALGSSLGLPPMIPPLCLLLSS